MIGSNIQILVGKLQAVFKVFAIAAPVFFAGCATNPLTEVSEIPKAFEKAVENTKSEDYPKLSDIPPMPKNILTNEAWKKEKSSLVKENKKLTNNKKSLAPTATELNTDWAIKTRDNLLRDPRAQDAPKMEDAILWAARMRAILDNQFTQKNQ
ncbi:MAG: hypothetical protein J0L55_15680 [Caulobacterales bacterium]|nr:hypothetical protein [Caulobacterales bacterium]